MSWTTITLSIATAILAVAAVVTGIYSIRTYNKTKAQLSNIEDESKLNNYNANFTKLMDHKNNTINLLVSLNNWRLAITDKLIKINIDTIPIIKSASTKLLQTDLNASINFMHKINVESLKQINQSILDVLNFYEKDIEKFKTLYNLTENELQLLKLPESVQETFKNQLSNSKINIINWRSKSDQLI